MASAIQHIGSNGYYVLIGILLVAVGVRYRGDSRM